MRAEIIESHKRLAEIVQAYKTLGQRIAFTQGTWDMFHEGHGDYLEKARLSADLLIVAVDSDELTRERKGPDRPFDPEEGRMSVISLLRPVDFIIKKGVEEHEHDLLKLIRPDVFIISKSTGKEIQKDIKEFEKYAGEVLNLVPQSSNSTTAKFLRLKKGVFEEFEGDLMELLKNARAKIEGKESK